ncbi:hypothetical protein [Shewanella putrefaciens]
MLTKQLVRETKSTRNRKDLRESEQDKIACGENTSLQLA